MALTKCKDCGQGHICHVNNIGKHQTVIGAIYDCVPGFAVESVGGRDILRCGDSQGSIAIDVGKLAAHILDRLDQVVGSKR